MGVINSILSSGLTIFFIGIIGVVFAYFSLLYRRKANIALTDIQYEMEAIESIQVEGRIPVNSLGEFVKISDNCKIFRRLLMEYRDELYTTQDATSTIEELWTPDILKSRIFPVVSTILTGLGVLGTFIGLSFGLKGLQLGGNMEHLQDQIQRVADGASIAFMTSICGVSLSLIFTYIEKRKSEQIINTIKKLNILLSSLFPPLPIMQVLVDTHEETKKSTDIQGRLAEQIGSKLQTVFDSFTNNLMQNIANNISSSSEQIKRCLVGESETSVSEHLQTVVDRYARALAGIVKTCSENIQSNITQESQNIILSSRQIKDSLAIESRNLGGIINTCGNNIRTSIDSNSRNLQGTFDGCSQSIISGISGSISSAGQQISNTVATSSDDTKTSIIHELGRITSIIEANTVNLQGILHGCSSDIISRISAGMSETSQQITDTITASNENIRTTIESQIQDIVPIITMNSENLQGTVSGCSTDILSAVSNVVETITTNSDRIKQGIASELQNIPSEVKIGIKTMVEEHLAPALGKLSGVSGDIKEIPGKIKEGMDKSINDNLSPAIEGLKTATEALAQGRADSSEAALRQLVTKFTESMGTEGDKQRTSLEETTNQFTSSIAYFTRGMISLIETVNRRKDSVEGTLEAQLTSMKQLLEQVNTLQEAINSGKNTFQTLSVSVQNASQSLEQASGHLQTSSEKLQGFGSSISEAMNKGTTSVERAVQIVSSIEKRQGDADKRFGTMIGKMGDIATKLETVHKTLEVVGQSLSGSAQQVTEGFEEAKKGFIELADHYTKFQQGLAAHMATMDEETQKQVKALDDHMTKLLDNYTQNVNKQVTELMTSWNDLTKDFCTNMTNVVAVMESLVNSLDLKRKQGETTA